MRNAVEHPHSPPVASPCNKSDQYHQRRCHTYYRKRRRERDYSGRNGHQADDELEGSFSTHAVSVKPKENSAKWAHQEASAAIASFIKGVSEEECKAYLANSGYT
jgi:DNA-directed RNA polymerase specialized sigma24 family protein